MNLWWIRRDLRLADNPALAAALSGGAGVIPVYILDETLLARAAEKRQGFLLGGLRALRAELRRLGSDLVVRRGESEAELARLSAEANARAVYAEEDVSPYARRRDAAVTRRLELHRVQGLGMHPAAAVTKADGSPYTVFTPYSRAWKALPLDAQPLPAPAGLPPLPPLDSLDLPEYPAPPGFPPGEAEALRRLDAFLDGPIDSYAEDRDRMDLDGTSSLSPYLRFGMLSARQAVSAALRAVRAARDAQARAGAEAWLNELIWREFYQAILYHFPHVLGSPFNPAYRAMRWRSAPADLLRWQAGRTGYPIVDAAMRQLAATGWMHNRARMISASFLVKHLLIDWREGERWFMRSLIDGDPAANNGGWQWVAGTGTDAAPYFRVFNPVLQGRKFDPQGDYVRRWVPELRRAPQPYIHTPWLMPPTEQRAAGVRIGWDYPAPLVEHQAARARALSAYKDSSSTPTVY